MATQEQKPKPNNVRSQLKDSRATVLKYAMHGILGVLQREFEIPLKYQVGETAKREIMRDLKDKTQITKSFGWVVPNAITGERDRYNTKTMQRNGLTTGLNKFTRNTSQKAFIFPVALGLELHLIIRDFQELILIGEALSIISMTDGLSFDLRIGGSEDKSDGLSFNSRIEVPLDFSIPLSVNNDTANPDGHELVVNLIVHTWCGFLKNVLAVTNSSPSIEVSIVRDESMSDILDSETFQMEFDPMEKEDGYKTPIT